MITPLVPTARTTFRVYSLRSSHHECHFSLVRDWSVTKSQPPSDLLDLVRRE